MIKFKKLTDTAQLPKRATDGAAGFDLHYDGDSMMLYPGQRHMFDTGIACAISPGRTAKVEPRSGWALKYGVDVLAGRIDQDYRGELKVILINHGDRSLQIFPNDRIAQLVVTSYIARAQEVTELDETGRGVDGFGSTGVN